MTLISFIAISAYLILIVGEVSFGQQAFFGIGAYITATITTLLGLDIVIALFFSFFGKISGIFHYFNESFVIDPLNDFERHFAWLSKTSLLSKIG